MSWYVSPALESLRRQVNTAAPTRSRVSDGTIGDPAHSARVSAHNPTAGGEVNAWDATHDPGNLDAHALADRLLAEQDPRLRLVISRGRIGSGPRGIKPGVWRRYDGPNPHDKHVHIETHPDSPAGPWAGITPAATAAAAPTIKGDDVARFIQASGSGTIWSFDGTSRMGLPTPKVKDELARTGAFGDGRITLVSPETLSAIPIAPDERKLRALLAAHVASTGGSQADVEAAVRAVFADAGQS